MGEAGRRCHSRLLSWSARAGGYYRNTRMARSLAAAAALPEPWRAKSRLGAPQGHGACYSPYWPPGLH